MKRKPVEIVKSWGCKNGSCPHVLESSDGRVFVQGTTVSSRKVGIENAKGESIVEIPRDLLRQWSLGQSKH